MAVFAIADPAAARRCGRSRRARGSAASSRGCSRASPGRSSAPPAIPSASAAGSRSLIPAYDEAESIGEVLARSRPRCAGSRRRCWSSTTARATRPARSPREHGATVARHVINRGGGAALRTGYRLAVESGARDRRHTRRRRPAPAGRDGAARRAGRSAARSTWRRAPGAGRGRAGPSGARARDRVLQPSRLAAHPDGVTRLLQRLSRDPRLGAAPARPAPGAVPHLGAADRGDQARGTGEGGAGDRRPGACTGTRRSPRSSATGSASRTRSSAPGFADRGRSGDWSGGRLPRLGKYMSSPQRLQTWT